jgi:hypothetical protein
MVCDIDVRQFHVTDVVCDVDIRVGAFSLHRISLPACTDTPAVDAPGIGTGAAEVPTRVPVHSALADLSGGDFKEGFPGGIDRRDVSRTARVDVSADRHLLHTRNKLSVDSIGVVCHAVLPIVPIGHQHHQASALFDQNRMIDHAWNIPDMLLHLNDKFVCDFIGDRFADHRSSTLHTSSPFSFVMA